jgi:hypothetical protein
MPSLAVRPIAAAFALAGMLLCAPAVAQDQPQDPAPPKPYKKVSVSMPPPITDPSFENFRKQLADIAQRKDRSALAALVVPKGFFWEREGGNSADDQKPGIDNFAAATGLDAPDGSGWEFLADYAAEPTASPPGDRPEMICAPANPDFNVDELLEVMKANGGNPFEWGYPLRDGIEAHQTPEPNSPLVEKLGMHFVRVVFDDEQQPDSADPMLRIVTPSGKLGYIPADGLSPLGIDQLCYVKIDGAWKIMGYVGEGAAR